MSNDYTSRITPYKTEPYGSRQDSYERSDGAEVKGKVNNWYNSFRTPKKKEYSGLPPRLDLDIVKKYNLRTISFGNWVKQFDRLNFCATLDIALADLQSVIAPVINNGLGKNDLTVDWGGRGQKRALGLYQSGARVINLRRFSRPDKLLKDLQELGQDTSPYLNKFFEPIKGQGGNTNYQLNTKGYIWVLGSSGFGSFAHEFGHYLDNYLGRQERASTGFISGRGVLPLNYELTLEDIQIAFFGKSGYSGIPARDLMLKVFIGIYYDKKTKNTVIGKVDYYTPSKALNNLDKYCQSTGGKETYWLSFIEVWARLFEVYVAMELDSKGVSNTFLVGEAKKFEIQVKVVDGKEITKEVGRLCYPDATSVKKVSKEIKQILNIFAKY